MKPLVTPTMPPTRVEDSADLERRSGSDTDTIALPFWLFAIVFLLIAGGTFVANKIARNSNGTSLNLE